MAESPVSAPPTPGTSGKAIASLVLSLLGLLGVLPLIGPILGIVFGNQARGEIAQSGGALTGAELAQAGVILGWIGLALNAAGLLCAILGLGATFCSLLTGLCTAVQRSSEAARALLHGIGP